MSGTIARNQALQATPKLGQGHRLDSVLSVCETTMVGVILETEGISEAFYVSCATAASSKTVRGH